MVDPMDMEHTGGSEPVVLERRGEIDYVLFAVVIIFYGLGVVMVFSASIGIQKGDAFHFLRKQLLWALISFAAFMVCTFIDYRIIERRIRLFVWAIIILLFFLLFPPLVVRGVVHSSRRWYRFSSVGFQPSEFAKIILIVYLASILSKKGDRINDFYRGFLPPFIVISVIAFLVFLEPDFSTAFLLFFIAILMFYIAGIRSISIISLIVVSIPALFLMINERGYRKERITGFLNPWADPMDKGYQIIQSFKAFARGGFAGVGLGRSIQKIKYLPIPHTDFIFAICAEEMGFIGVFLIIVLYMILAYRGYRIAWAQQDRFDFLLGFGITSLIIWETILNIAVVTGLLPSTGISLPFLSYGGSSLLSNSIMMGILLNISRKSTATAPRMLVQRGESAV